MAAHRINLRGPWDFTFTSAADPATMPNSSTGSVRMPESWQTIFGTAAGTAEFRRKFHCPTNLESHERVMLVLTEVRGEGQLVLNQSAVGQFTSSGESVEFEITRLLNPFNELMIEITFDPQQVPGATGGLYGLVALEIRSD